MDALLAELGKYGPMAIVAAVFIWQNIVDKRALNDDRQRLAERLNTVQDQMMGLVKNNTEAMNSLKSAIAELPCPLRTETGELQIKRKAS